MNPANPLPFTPEHPGDANRFQVLQPTVENPFDRSCRALDLKLKREVVLRFAPKAQWAEWKVDIRKRIEREAMLMAQVNSDRVIRVFDVLQSDMGPVIVMEIPEGEPIMERLREGLFSPAATRSLALEIARALADVHRANVVYRALGPASVLVTAADKVKLADFTFAKNHELGGAPSFGNGEKISVDEELRKHLPPYLAPEVQSGQDADARADIYALGSLMYRCLVGVDPFAAAGTDQPAQQLMKSRPDCPRALAEIIRRCMAPSRSARFATAAELEQALLACPEAEKISRRNLLASGVVGSLLLAGTAWTYLRRPAEQPDQGPVFEPGYTNLRALLIGINEYDHNKIAGLKTAERDIEAVYRVLGNLGWPEKNIHVPPRPDRNEVINWIKRINSDAKHNDAVLVYFAGHGIKVGSESVLLPRNGVEADEKTHLTPRDFHGNLPAPKHVLYVFDACHSEGMKGVATLPRSATATEDGAVPAGSGLNRDGDSLKRRAGGGAEKSSSVKFTMGWWRGVVWSAAPNQKASDGDVNSSGDGNSPFCKAFCEALDPKGELFRSTGVKQLGLLTAVALQLHLTERLGKLPQAPGMLSESSNGSSFVFTPPRTTG